MVAAHSLSKTFNYRHEKLMVEQRPEVSWEDSMLVYPGLESSREPRLASLAPLFSASLSVSTGCFDGVSVIQTAVGDLPKASEGSDVLPASPF